MWFQCLIFLKVFQAVTGGSSPKYVWPVCSKSYNFEVQDGGQTHPTIDASDYDFLGPHSSIPCDPINFDATTYTHMDLPVNNANQFDKLSFCVFIKASSSTGTVLHYRSGDGMQNIIILVDNGQAVVTYTTPGTILELRTDNGAMTVNKWYLISFIMYDGAASTKIMLLDGTNVWGKIGSSVPSILNLPGTIRIGSQFDATGSTVSSQKRFNGQMICLAMYDSEFSSADYGDSLNLCSNGISFPAASQLPSTPAPPPPVVCNSTTHKQRNATHFSRLTNHVMPSIINHLDQKNTTSLRVCAAYCVSSTKCVSFSVTHTQDGFKTCRLYEVFDPASVVADTTASLYVLHSCRFL